MSLFHRRNVVINYARLLILITIVLFSSCYKKKLFMDICRIWKILNLYGTRYFAWTVNVYISVILHFTLKEQSPKSKKMESPTWLPSSCQNFSTQMEINITSVPVEVEETMHLFYRVEVAVTDLLTEYFSLLCSRLLRK